MDTSCARGVAYQISWCFEEASHSWQRLAGAQEILVAAVTSATSAPLAAARLIMSSHGMAQCVSWTHVMQHR